MDFYPYAFFLSLYSHKNKVDIFYYRHIPYSVLSQKQRRYFLRHTPDSVFSQEQGSLDSNHRHTPYSVFKQEQGSLVSIHRHTPDSVISQEQGSLDLGIPLILYLNKSEVV